MSVGRICRREVDLADADESVWQAAERMQERTVGTLVVLNEAKEPVGIVTDRDLVVGVIARGKAPHSTMIRDVMTSPVKTISEESAIEAALALMRSGGFRRLPVVDSQGKLVGVLSLDDVIALLAEEFTQIGQLLEQQTPRPATEP